MNQYVGLDVSLEETKIYVLDEAGGRVWRGKCASHPDELETAICKHAPGALRIGLETGPLTTWLWTLLCAPPSKLCDARPHLRPCLTDFMGRKPRLWPLPIPRGSSSAYSRARTLPR